MSTTSDLVETCNAVARQIQFNLGVNPEECLRMGMLPDSVTLDVSSRTPYQQFLGGLASDGVLLTTEEWYQRHDERVHAQAIEECHPNLAKLIIEGATEGARLADKRFNIFAHRKAKRIADVIDDLLVATPGVSPTTSTIRANLVFLASLATLPSLPKQEDEQAKAIADVAEIQRRHTKLFRGQANLGRMLDWALVA